MSQRIFNEGCQRGGYRCDCGFSVSKRDKWRRHVRNCELAEVESASLLSSPGRTPGGSRGGRRGGGGCAGGGGVVDTSTRTPDFVTHHAGGQEQDTPPGTASNSLPPVPDVPLYVPGEQGPASEASSPSSPDGAEGLAYTPATSPPHAPGPTLLERLADLAVSDPNYPTSSGDSDELVCDDYGADDGGWANGVYNDEEGCGLGSDVENGCVAAGDGVPSADGRSGDASPGAATLNNAKRLDQLHVGLGGRVLEGGASNCTFNTKAKGSQYFPYENFSVLLLFQLVHKFQLSETMLSGFLTILTTVHNGESFNVDDIRGIDAKHFYARRRSQHPLLEVVETMVPTTRGDQALVPVYDVPLNLILDRKLRSPSFLNMCVEGAAGKVLTSEEAQRSGLSSDHLFGVPTKPLGNALGTNMHGSLARSSPFFGFDGLLGARTGNRKVYINDVAMFSIDDVGIVPCRFLELFWDFAQNAAMVSVRRLRTRSEMRDVDGGERFKGLVRVWEEEGPDSKLTVGTRALQDVCEMYTRDEALGMPLNSPWKGGVRWDDWDAFVGEGFALRRPKRRLAAEQLTHPPPPFVESSAPWSREGTGTEPLFGIRKPEFRHNFSNKPYASVPFVVMNDAFNALAMSNKHSVGATYFGWGWASNEVQRRRSETVLGTIASPGACVEGELALQASILGELQRGCDATARIATADGGEQSVEIFVRGGPLLWVSDSPQRAKVLGCKHPNNSTKLPCPYCKAKQVDGHPTFGDLGDRKYKVKRNARTYGEAQEGWQELQDLESDLNEQTKRSQELGMVAPTSISRGTLGRPLFEKMKIDARRHVPVEILHADALGSQALVQVFCLNLLNEAGRTAVSSVIRQRGTLYPPATDPLKDICSNYSSLRGCDKWLLGSILLLVFRCVLHDATSLERYVKARELSALIDTWGGEQAVLLQLRKLLQVASALTFAVRAPSFDEKERKQLAKHARDTVGVYAELLGRGGVRTVVHSALHYVDAIEDHGRMPDASTGESAHQARKRVNASSSNRNAALHYARRSNMDLAIVALAEGVPWQLTRFDRGRKHYVVQTVTPGAGCTAVLRMLGDALPGGLSSAPTDSRTASTPTAAESRGQFVGAANWSSTLLESGGGGGNPGSWEASVATGLLRPDERTLLDGYTTFFSCGRSSGPVCLEERCSTCWDNPSTLDIKEIECSRFKHGASPRSSSGLRRWKGGNAKAAARAGPPLAWALGEDAGEDVEFYTKQPFNDSSPSGALSSARILYFFTHRGNKRSGTPERPSTSWVLAFDFVNDGVNNQRSPDPVTLHPVMKLRGNGRPIVFPAAAIRRHVHMYHRCPGLDHPRADSAWACGPQRLGSGGALVWRHKFRLASPGNGCDRYVLNEFHHSIARDTFV